MINEKEEGICPASRPKTHNVWFEGQENLTIRQATPEPETLPVPDDKGELTPQINIWIEGQEDLTVRQVLAPQPEEKDTGDGE
jgi:hypothetical protein